MKKLCIYHGNCADGFGAAYAVWEKFGDEVEFHAGVHQNPPPDVTGRDVILVDFSYKRPVLLEMAKTARTITILDHHKSAAEDLAPFAEVGNWAMRDSFDVFEEQCSFAATVPVRALFDMNRSGAMIAWQYFHPDKSVPRLISYIQDRDLWKFELPYSRNIAAMLFSYSYDFELWDSLCQQMEDDIVFEDLSYEGGAIERKHHKDVAELVAAFRYVMKIGGINVPVANLPYTLTSDAGHLMAQGAPFAACYWDTPECRVFSLRSTEAGLDVSEIAKQYGGGGHRNAAGFRLPHGKAP